jgi:hypothetical protein
MIDNVLVEMWGMVPELVAQLRATLKHALESAGTIDGAAGQVILLFVAAHLFLGWSASRVRRIRA